VIAVNEMGNQSQAKSRRGGGARWKQPRNKDSWIAERHIADADVVADELRVGQLPPHRENARRIGIPYSCARVDKARPPNERLTRRRLDQAADRQDIGQFSRTSRRKFSTTSQDRGAARQIFQQIRRDRVPDIANALEVRRAKGASSGRSSDKVGSSMGQSNLASIAFRAAAESAGQQKSNIFSRARKCCSRVAPKP